MRGFGLLSVRTRPSLLTRPPPAGSFIMENLDGWGSWEEREAGRIGVDARRRTEKNDDEDKDEDEENEEEAHGLDNHQIQSGCVGGHVAIYISGFQGHQSWTIAWSDSSIVP